MIMGACRGIGVEGGEAAGAGAAAQQRRLCHCLGGARWARWRVAGRGGRWQRAVVSSRVAGGVNNSAGGGGGGGSRGRRRGKRLLGQASRGGDARARRLQEGGRGNAGKGAGKRSVYSSCVSSWVQLAAADLSRAQVQVQVGWVGGFLWEEDGRAAVSAGLQTRERMPQACHVAKASSGGSAFAGGSAAAR